MTDKNDKSGKPTAQVLRLVGADHAVKAEVKKAFGPQVSMVSGKDAPAGAVQSNAFQNEDEFQDLYVGAAQDKGILEPPYNLRTLDRLSQENNALSPCIEAMVTNIDGTGYDFESTDEEVEDDEDDDRIDQLHEFFAEVWPGRSFVETRKLLRRDLERVGNAYLEVLRNAQDEIVFLRHVDAKMMRLLKLDEAIPVEKTIRRGGRELKVTVMQRERRYCQIVNGVSLMYFKDFGVERDLHRTGGTWVNKGQRLAAKDRATEIIHFTNLPDAHTPYGVPRWISQLPSVLGSRKAEEFNLEFFDNGGVPPVLIILQGGALQTESRKALEQKMVFGSAASKQRAQVLEVEPTGGSLDHPTQAKVTVERFGGERTNDSMFEKYDEKCEARIRRAFRLPPIFVGQAADYAFATAFVSYTVAEAQVFKPERDEFDEIITMKILRDMGYHDLKLLSKPLTIEDVNLKMEGIALALETKQVEMADIIYEINQACGTNIKVSEQPQHEAGAQLTVDDQGNIVPVEQLIAPEQGREAPEMGDGAPSDSAPSRPKRASAQKAEATAGVMALAYDTLEAMRKRDFAVLGQNLKLVSSLDPRGFESFRKAAAALQFVDPSHDIDGLAELTGCTISVLSREQVHKHEGCCEHAH